jgi:hypothetical protein
VNILVDNIQAQSCFVGVAVVAQLKSVWVTTRECLRFITIRTHDSNMARNEDDLRLVVYIY